MGLFNKMLGRASGTSPDARRPLPDLLVRMLAPLILAGTCMGALAQADPPGRVARLGNAEGPVFYSAAGDDEWVDAQLNRPLVGGDRLWTDKRSRADVQVGSAAVRIDGQTQLQVVVVDDQNAQFRVTKGSVFVRVRVLPEGENFEVSTPNLTFRAAYPGDYRLDVDPQWGTTRVTIFSGTGTVHGDGGQSMSLGGGQQVTYRAPGLAKVLVGESPSHDNFDRWAAERNRREDQSVAARYVPRDVVGYQSLDAAGKWSHDPTYGAVWVPEFTPANWAPFRNGRWEWIAPWGWTWIDDAPWGFACSHYGRWAMIGNRWAWVPGRMGPRPIFAPALVAFVGRPERGSAPAGGKSVVAWFPLAPGEPWQPGFRATPLYLSGVNYNMPPVPAGDTYAFKGKTEALTVITAEDFNRGKPVVGGWLRVAGNVLAQAQIVSAPPMPARPATQLVARAAPAVDIRNVADVQRPAAPPAAAADAQQAQREQQAAQEAQARAAEMAKAEMAKAEKAQAEKARQQAASQVERASAAEQARIAEETRQAQARAKADHAAARQAERARAAEQSRQAVAAQRAGQEAAARAQAVAQAKATEQSRRAEQKRREAQARSAAEAKRQQVARSEKAKREQVAAAQREQQRRQQAAHAKALREDQARRAAAAKKDQARRATAYAQHMEQAQRAADHDAQALREQRLRREEAVRSQAEDPALRETLQRPAQRPVLRTPPATPTQPEVWQRGIPILLGPGRTS